MAKPQTKQQQTYSWVVYRLRGMLTQFIGPIYDLAAIKQAIEEFKVCGPMRRGAMCCGLRSRLLGLRLQLLPVLGILRHLLGWSSFHQVNENRRGRV